MDDMKPVFYDKFQCIADTCDFTCCQQWKIAVDDDTNAKWKNTKPPKGMKTRRKNMSLFTTFKDGQRVIGLDQKKQCPFLNEDKLCRLVCEYGDSMISRTCQIFPREIHDFEDHKEYTLMPCCPVTVDYLKEDPFELVGDDADIKHSDLHKLRRVFMEIQKDPSYSLEEGLLINFYMLLDEYEKWCEKEAESYEMFYQREELLSFSGEIKKTLGGLDFDLNGGFAECNELFLDLVENYRKEGLYQEYLEEPAVFADDISEGIIEDTFTYQEFQKVWKEYELLFRNFLVQEYYADLLIPGADLESMVVKLQWIGMEYAAIRHLCFLHWKLHGGLDYKAVRDYIVMCSRMMGYEEEDICEYMENSFEDLIWDWGYMALIIGR